MANVLINTLVAFLIGGATLSFNFKTVDSSGKLIYDGNGTVITKDNSYRIETADAILVSDGTLKGIYQKSIDEIVLQPVGETSADYAGLMDNPFAMLQDIANYYEVTTWKGGKKVTSAAPGTLPDKIQLKSQSGATYTLQINSAERTDSPNSALFSLRPEDYPSAVVTDLR